jgi:hypothetical protein
VIEYQDRLRSLALSDDHFVGSVLGMSQDTVEISRLEPKTHALVRLAALLAVDAGQSSYNASVDVALDGVVGGVIGGLAVAAIVAYAGRRDLIDGAWRQVIPGAGAALA